ncbi:MAG: hypothetical protein K2P81_03200 [Bacteriovoracaceae bacterium]|nr:hypothetical protein [Bacteriovoracaceae bacterium]
MKILILMILISSAWAGPVRQKKLNTNLTRHYWYDGEVKREIWLHADAVSSLKGAGLKEKSNPVFRDQNDPQAMSRTPTGHIIITFKKEWSETEIEGWILNQKFKRSQKLDFGKNVYLVEVNSGMEALERANLIYQSGEVSSASPDWRQEVETK